MVETSHEITRQFAAQLIRSVFAVFFSINLQSYVAKKQNINKNTSHKSKKTNIQKSWKHRQFCQTKSKNFYLLQTIQPHYDYSEDSFLARIESADTNKTAQQNMTISMDNTECNLPLIEAVDVLFLVFYKLNI